MSDHKCGEIPEVAPLRAREALAAILALCALLWGAIGLVAWSLWIPS